MLDIKRDQEWMAWRAFCKELKRLGVDINDHDTLTQLLRNWGDRLVELRDHQAAHSVTS